MVAAGPHSASAQDVPAPPTPTAPSSPALATSASAALASDYVFRGLDRSEHLPSGSVGVDATGGDLYAGAWAANVRDPAGPRTRDGAETDLYGGWRPSAYGFDLSLGGIYYGFIDQPGRLSFAEGYAKASRGLGPVTLSTAAYLSPSYSGRTGFASYLELGGAYPLTPKLTLSATAGRQTIADAPSYTTWALGGVYALTDRLSLELRYVDTDHSEGGYPYHARLIAALKAGF